MICLNDHQQNCFLSCTWIKGTAISKEKIIKTSMSQSHNSCSFVFMEGLLSDKLLWFFWFYCHLCGVKLFIFLFWHLKPTSFSLNSILQLDYVFHLSYLKSLLGPNRITLCDTENWNFFWEFVFLTTSWFT